MRLSLSAISTVNASFAQDVEAYAAAGFDAIGLWEFKLPGDDAANRRLAAGFGSLGHHFLPGRREERDGADEPSRRRPAG